MIFNNKNKYSLPSEASLAPRSLGKVGAKQGFTLIELLVVIAIIGVLATLAVVSMTSIRSRARDSKRISDLKQIATTLELYYADHNAYPTTLTFGSQLVGATNGKTYIAKVPTNPTPRAEGACADLEYQYTGTASDFSLMGCIAKASGDAPAGARKIERGGNARNLGPTDGIVGWWMVDGINGTRDLNAMLNNGTISGPVATSTGHYGESSGAYNFESSNTTVVNLGDPVSGLFDFGVNNFSISSWAKVNGTTASRGTVTSKWLSGGSLGFNEFIVAFSGPTGTERYPSATIESGSTLYVARGATQVTLGQWNHIVAVRSDTNLMVYLNGQVASSTSVGSVAVNNISGRVLKIGNINSETYGFQGSINDLRLYNRALSADDVSALYNATKP